MKKSYFIAGALALTIIGWMSAGYFTAGGKPRQPPAELKAEPATSLVLVQVVAKSAETIMKKIVAQGRVSPDRLVTVRAETAGRISGVVAQEGRSVQAGDILVRIEMDDRNAKLEKAEALVDERLRAYKRANNLGDKGFQSQGIIDESYTALKSAQAALQEIQLDIAHTTIRVPFDSILEMRHVEVGDYVAINSEIATIVDNDPLVITVQIAQLNFAAISLGSNVDVDFATGSTGRGKVRYIAPRADESTRTFKVEIEVPNSGSKIPSGTSAEAMIPTGSVSAHFISPALLSLSTSGQVGIKVVSDNNTVAFHPVTIELAEANGIWVSGLPDIARIITVGQGFVREGDVVRIADEETTGQTSNSAQQISEQVL